MAKTLIATCAYGGLPFLKLLLSEIQATVTEPHDVLVVVAKPGDEEMRDFVFKSGVKMIAHDVNKGFPASCNDIYQFAFVDGDYNQVIFCGNDIVPMPGAIDAMIRTANGTEWEMICGSEFNSRFLYDHYEAAREHFDGPNLIVKESAFTARPWELNKDFRNGVEPDTLKDVRNMTLFKRSSFEKVGFEDVNFYPGGYFSDNDYCLRCNKLQVKAAGLKEAAFFHFWSRTIHEGENRAHGVYYDRNRVYYTHKWHGEPGSEKLDTPFGGGPYTLGGISVPCDMKIASRDHEAACIEYWSSL